MHSSQKIHEEHFVEAKECISPRKKFRHKIDIKSLTQQIIEPNSSFETKYQQKLDH